VLYNFVTCHCEKALKSSGSDESESEARGFESDCPSSGVVDLKSRRGLQCIFSTKFRRTVASFRQKRLRMFIFLVCILTFPLNFSKLVFWALNRQNILDNKKFFDNFPTAHLFESQTQSWKIGRLLLMYISTATRRTYVHQWLFKMQVNKQ